VTGLTVWLTGLPASGKTTLAAALVARLAGTGRGAHVLDGDELRRGLSRDLDLSRAGRAENVRRAGEVAALLAGQGAIVVAGLVSPYRADRDAVRSAHEQAGLAFVEVWVATPSEECARRDVKDLYRRAAAGELAGLTGWDAPYEKPLRPEVIVLPTTADDGVDPVLRVVLKRLG
jgi:bifunctional enzyme CysN/CysC